MAKRTYNARQTEPTADEIRAALTRQECPWCDGGPFRVVACHVAHYHGYTANQVKDLAALPYSFSTSAADVADAHRQRMLDSQIKPPDATGERVPRPGGVAARKSRLVNLGKAQEANDSPDVRKDRTERLMKVYAGDGRREQIEKARLRRMQRFDADLGPATHGSLRMYARGCRCDECRAARSAHNKLYRQRRAQVSP